MADEVYRVVVITGDGIGPHLVEAAVSVLEAVQQRLGSFRLDFEYHEGGAAEYMRTGRNLSPETSRRSRPPTRR